MAIVIDIDASSKQNKLVAGTNITIDETNPLVPIINAEDVDIEVDVTPIVGGTDGRISFQKAGKVSQSSALSWNDTDSSLNVNSAFSVAAYIKGSVNSYVEIGDFTKTGTSAIRAKVSGGQLDLSVFSGTSNIISGAGANTLNFIIGGGNVLTAKFGGFIGVNQQTPTSLLHVKAKLAGTAVVARVENSVGTGDLFSVTENGYLGVGTGTPAHSGALGASSNIINVHRASGSTGLTLSVGTNFWDIANIAATGIWFINNNSTKAVLLNNGNFGLNQTTPTSLFHVKAKLAGTAVVARIENSAGTGDLFSVAENGNVVAGSATNGLTYEASLDRTTFIGSSSDSNIRVVGSGAQTSIYIKGTGSASNTYSLVKNSGVDGMIIRGNNDSFGFASNIAYFMRNGNFGVGIIPTAIIHAKAGTATAGTAPLKLTSGVNLTTPENGAFEFDGTNLYFTTGGVRKTVTLV